MRHGWSFELALTPPSDQTETPPSCGCASRISLRPSCGGTAAALIYLAPTPLGFGLITFHGHRAAYNKVSSHQARRNRQPPPLSSPLLLAVASSGRPVVAGGLEATALHLLIRDKIPDIYAQMFGVELGSVI